MEIISTTRPARVASPAVVVFSDAAEVDIQDLKAAAYVAVNENPRSCFGADVRRHDDGGATVTIWRD